MGVRVSADQLNLFAERKVIQYSMCQVADLLEYGQTPEDYFEDNWDDEDEDGIDYYIEVDGVVPQSDFNNMVETYESTIADLKKRVENCKAEYKLLLDEKGYTHSYMSDEKVEEPRL